jgi:hypothetical protein
METARAKGPMPLINTILRNHPSHLFKEATPEEIREHARNVLGDILYLGHPQKGPLSNYNEAEHGPFKKHFQRLVSMGVGRLAKEIGWKPKEKQFDVGEGDEGTEEVGPSSGDLQPIDLRTHAPSEAEDVAKERKRLNKSLPGRRPAPFFSKHTEEEMDTVAKRVREGIRTGELDPNAQRVFEGMLRRESQDSIAKAIKWRTNRVRDLIKTIADLSPRTPEPAKDVHPDEGVKMLGNAMQGIEHRIAQMPNPMTGGMNKRKYPIDKEALSQWAHARLAGIGNHQMIGRPEYPAMTDKTRVRAAHRTFNWFVENNPGALPPNVVEQIQRESKTAGTGANAKLRSAEKTPKIDVEALQIPTLTPEIQRLFGKSRWQHAMAILRARLQRKTWQEVAGDNAAQVRGYWIHNVAPALRNIMSPYLKSFFKGRKGGLPAFVPLTDQQADQVFGKIRPEIVLRQPIKRGKISKADRFAAKFASDFARIYGGR